MDLLNNSNIDIEKLSPLALAFNGDCVYELLARNYVLKKGITNVNRLSIATRKIVNAGTQSKMYDAIKDILTEEEEAIYKKGRNAKSHSKAKNQTIVAYRRATGIEALFGYLYIKRNYNRLTELFEKGIDIIERS